MFSWEFVDWLYFVETNMIDPLSNPSQTECGGLSCFFSLSDLSTVKTMSEMSS